MAPALAAPTPGALAPTPTTGFLFWPVGAVQFLLSLLVSFGGNSHFASNFTATVEE